MSIDPTGALLLADGPVANPRVVQVRNDHTGEILAEVVTDSLEISNTPIDRHAQVQTPEDPQPRNVHRFEIGFGVEASGALLVQALLDLIGGQFTSLAG